jgi:hypothetical protein
MHACMLVVIGGAKKFRWPGRDSGETAVTPLNVGLCSVVGL